MKIADLKDRSKVDMIELRIFSAKYGAKAFPDKKIPGKINNIQQVLAADKDSIKSPETPSIKLDIDVDKFPGIAEGDNVRVTDAYSQLIVDPKRKQFKIGNAMKIEKI